MTTLQTAESPHLTVKQLAKRWHTTPQAIYNMRHRRKAPKGFKRGRELLMPISEIERFEADGMSVDRTNPDLDPTQAPPEASRPRTKAALRKSTTAQPVGART
jgi:hypothetical protein